MEKDRLDSDLSSANWITVGKSLTIKSQFSSVKWYKSGPLLGFAIKMEYILVHRRYSINGDWND